MSIVVEGRVEHLGDRDVAEVQRRQRVAIGATSTGWDDSVRIVVPPRKSIPKFSPIASQMPMDSTIATMDAPNVSRAYLKKSIFGVLRNQFQAHVRPRSSSGDAGSNQVTMNRRVT